MLHSLLFRHSSLLTRACSNGRTLSTSPASTSVGCVPTTHSSAVSKLAFFNSVTGDGSKIPNYRVLDTLGVPVEGAEVPKISKQFARQLYENMQLLPTLDDILCSGQRQGRIPFYATSYGEEATVIGSAAALADDDEVLCRTKFCVIYVFANSATAQYRETGVLLWRGFTLDGIMAQAFGNHEDSSKGRQIGVHYSSKQHHFHTISSPLATQIPQVAGVGFALKRDPARRSKNVACVFFGEGAASEGDFHAGMLLASTLPSPTLLLARNNGFAISTPNSQQFHGDGISARGPGYGMDTVRVDGNDVLAVMNAVKEARKRVSHHSTSDDSYVYRERQEVEDRKKNDNPITRFRLFMESRGWWNETDEEELASRLRRDVIKAFKRAETIKKPRLEDMFTDVYAEEPWNIKEQQEELVALLKKYEKVWEPWQNELGDLKDGGKKLSD
ncbi:branched-chain alpha-keto acid dehydrogenase E1-alpha subunit [Suillus subaureus]|uniref:2-oxoisovalerate dehydrogenase subunit alpha n=1 Tax=Suillus subaureus TaxID=48587 RepID=A0A9P7EKZ6_9AGAM|nr:branched-chain alpha-keto acid dehydrogenase E1-alpha subunit [Suillus subaureus]KAG1824857.1 branched-chain alpha-keto acid dehydrogenase E1-alpha subunit [Suillus subaureus]